MYSVEYYQLPKSKRWRWKLLFGKKVLARGENSYPSRSKAKRSFESVRNGLRLYPMKS